MDKSALTRASKCHKNNNDAATCQQLADMTCIETSSLFNKRSTELMQPNRVPVDLGAESVIEDEEDFLYIPPAKKKNILDTVAARLRDNPFISLLNNVPSSPHDFASKSAEEKKKWNISQKRKSRSNWPEEDEEVDQGTILTYFMFYVPKLFCNAKKPEVGRDPRLLDNWDGKRESLIVRFGDYKQEVREKVDSLRNQAKFADKAVQFVCLIAHTEPIIQRGPTCGLVALCMAAGAFQQMKEENALASYYDCTAFGFGASGQDQLLSVDAVLETARKQGYSAHGEIYSCDDMKSLLQQFLPSAFAQVVHNWDTNLLVSHLLSGGMAMVPYDSDHHYDPDKRNGRKSHWAVLLGCLVVLPTKLVKSESFRHDLWRDADLKEVVCRSNTDDDVFTPYGHEHITPLASLYHVLENELNDEQLEECRDQLVDFYIIARQGKHHFMGFWNSDRLHESNAQLLTSDKKRLHEFVLNDGSVEAGLAKQIILLRHI